MQVEILLPIMMALAPTLIVLIVLFFRHQQTQARYRALMYLADKGVELPMQLLAEPRIGFCERRRALVLISIGLGLIAMLSALPMHDENGHGANELWGLGLLPLITGLGYLASWWLNHREGKHD